jgi:hypothetical protein
MHVLTRRLGNIVGNLVGNAVGNPVDNAYMNRVNHKFGNLVANYLASLVRTHVGNIARNTYCVYLYTKCLKEYRRESSKLCIVMNLERNIVGKLVEFVGNSLGTQHKIWWRGVRLWG